MIHQPNSLDSVDGEPPLPFDPIPVRLDTGEKRTKILIAQHVYLLSLDHDPSLMIKMEENTTFYNT